MEYCEIVLSLFSNSNCCQPKPNHEHGVSIGTIIFSEHSDIGKISESFDQQEEKKPKDRIIETLETRNVTNMIFTNDDSFISIIEDPEKIWDAVDNNDLETLQSYLLSQDVSSLEDSDGLTLLHRSVIAGNLVMTEALLGKVDVEAKDNLGRTALHYASMKKSLDIIIELLKNGAKPIVFDKFGKTPEDYAKKSKEVSEIFSHTNEIIEESIEKQKKNSEISMGRLKVPQVAECEESFSGRFSDISERVESGNKKLKRLTGPKEASVHLNFLESFSVIKFLGSSSIGGIYLIRNNQSGQEYSLKVLEKSKITDDFLELINNEKTALSSMSHPFIVSLLYTLQTTSKLLMVLEYCDRGNLAQLLRDQGALEVDVIKLCTSEIVLALDYIHDKGFMYRGLLAKNVLFDVNGHAVLSNFQLCKKGIVEETPGAGSMCRYLPPEANKGEVYGKEADWYMLGLLLYQMATGKDYLYESNKAHIENAALKDLIDNLLLSTPWKRLGFKNGAKDIKNHEFFAEVDWDKVLHKKVQMPLPSLSDKFPQFVDLDLDFDDHSEKDQRFPSWSFANM